MSSGITNLEQTGHLMPVGNHWKQTNVSFRKKEGWDKTLALFLSLLHHHRLVCEVEISYGRLIGWNALLIWKRIKFPVSSAVIECAGDDRRKTRANNYRCQKVTDKRRRRRRKQLNQRQHGSPCCTTLLLLACCASRLNGWLLVLVLLLLPSPPPPPWM